MKPRPDDRPDPELPAEPALRRAEEIRLALQAEIESGQLVPGTALDERSLTERFSVSRTPVREALQQLATLELVRMAPRQGALVAKLSVNKVRGMLELISELEGVVAMLATRRQMPDLGPRLRNALASCERALAGLDAAAYAVANADFHDQVYTASRNAYMVDMLRSTRRQIRRYRFSPLFTVRQMTASLIDHARIVDAILSGEEAAAAAAAKLHVPYGNSGFAEFLALVPPEYIADA